MKVVSSMPQQEPPAVASSPDDPAGDPDNAPLAIELVTALSPESDAVWIDGPDGPRALERSEPKKINDLFERARRLLPTPADAGQPGNGDPGNGS
jgi:hypothetical protein